MQSEPSVLMMSSNRVLSATVTGARLFKLKMSV
jgi:hypothetical protein